MTQYTEAAHFLFDKNAQKPIHHVKNRNIAVCGCQGCGKSTFITSFLHLDNKGVGVIKSIDGIISYRNTNFPNLVFWEMPDLGMDNFKGPEKNYFMDKKLYAFDCILILTSSSTFSDLGAQISIDARNWNRRYAMVKTKADIHAKDMALATRSDMNVAGVILRLETNRSLEEQPKMAGSAPFFIISSLAYTEHYSYQYMHENGYVDNSLREMDEGHLFNYVIDCVNSRFNSMAEWELNNQVQEDDAEDEYGFIPFRFEVDRGYGYDEMMAIIGALLFIS